MCQHEINSTVYLTRVAIPKYFTHKAMFILKLKSLIAVGKD